MIRVCKWCSKIMGEKPPLEETRKTYGICDECGFWIRWDANWRGYPIDILPMEKSPCVRTGNARSADGGPRKATGSASAAGFTWRR